MGVAGGETETCRGEQGEQVNQEAGWEEACVPWVQEVNRVLGQGDEALGAKGDNDYSEHEKVTQH